MGTTTGEATSMMSKYKAAQAAFFLCLQSVKWVRAMPTDLFSRKKSSMARQVICKSGQRGFEDKLHSLYENYEEFFVYSDTYNLHSRLGFDTPREAWDANPTVQGSVNPSDYCQVH